MSISLSGNKDSGWDNCRSHENLFVTHPQVNYLTGKWSANELKEFVLWLLLQLQFNWALSTLSTIVSLKLFWNFSVPENTRNFEYFESFATVFRNLMEVIRKMASPIRIDWIQVLGWKWSLSAAFDIWETMMWISYCSLNISWIRNMIVYHIFNRLTSEILIGCFEHSWLNFYFDSSRLS